MITENVRSIANLLKTGGVAGIPTETVYGLAASIENERALKRVFEIKERPFFDPLIVHIPYVNTARTLVKDWPEVAEILAEAFWPGPLTIVLEKSEQVNSLITSGLSSVGIRMPRHPICLELLRTLGVALAAPSANKFGRVSPTSALHVEAEFGGNFPVLDGGPCEVGVESTVVRPTAEALEILRPGLVSEQNLYELFKRQGIEMEIRRVQSQASPGHLDQHYQPKVPLFILGEGDDIETIRARAKLASEGEEIILGDDPLIAARMLYSLMRDLSERSSFIWVRRPGIQKGTAWDAIWDRLNRASSKS